MGTTIYNKNGLSVRRFAGGVERGVCYQFDAQQAELTKGELKELAALFLVEAYDLPPVDINIMKLMMGSMLRLAAETIDPRG